MTVSLIVGLVIVGIGILILIRSRKKASHHLDHLHISGDQEGSERSAPPA
jgi:hypothetical protein